MSFFLGVLELSLSTLFVGDHIPYAWMMFRIFVNADIGKSQPNRVRFSVSGRYRYLAKIFGQGEAWERWFVHQE